MCLLEKNVLARKFLIFWVLVALGAWFLRHTWGRVSALLRFTGMGWIINVSQMHCVINASNPQLEESFLGF